MDTRPFSEFFFVFDYNFHCLNKQHSFLQNVLGREYEYYKERLQMLDSSAFLKVNIRGDIMQISVKPINQLQMDNNAVLFKEHEFSIKRERVKHILDWYLNYCDRVLQSHIIDNN